MKNFFKRNKVMGEKLLAKSNPQKESNPGNWVAGCGNAE